MTEKSKPDFDAPLWDSDTLAAYLGIHRQTVVDWRSQGKGPRFFKTGPGRSAHTRYQRSVVMEWQERLQAHQDREQARKRDAE